MYFIAAREIKNRKKWAKNIVIVIGILGVLWCLFLLIIGNRNMVAYSPYLANIYFGYQLLFNKELKDFFIENR